MKRVFNIALLVLSCVVIIILHATAAEIDYISQISKNDCFLCGDHSHTKHESFWGKNNIGLVHLNTFDVLPLRIIRYSDSGEILREKFGILETSGLYRDDTYANATTDPDRGYSSVQITKVKYAIDRKAIETHLCGECIQAMNGVNWSDEESPEFAIINFQDRTIRPLDRSLTGFFSGDFGIHCEYKDDGAINLVVAYLPPRYEES